MSSRDEILARLRARPVPPVGLPTLDHERQTFDDLRAKFAEVLKAVGGEAVAVPDVAAVNVELAKLATYTAANKVVSLVPGAGEPNVDPAALDRPHDLEDVDYAILPGRFGVAENAAVWLDLRDVKHRVICVLAQHLAIVLPAAELVPTMHEAYARLTRPGSPEADFLVRPGYGLFLSGPSKTADIEQSLVIGAHGARSLTVFLVESLPSQG
ncbi:MAG TPA: LUD domain-containing protein [Planctomycetaceae bacterium]